MTSGKRIALLISVLFVSAVIVYAAVGQTSKQAVDPVCGMKVDTAAAKYKFAFEGKTFYFCSEACLNKFKADPCMYCETEGVKKAQETAKKAVPAGMQEAAKPMHKEGCTGECMKDAKVEVTNLPNGVVIKITSDNPETVKKIQAMHKDGCCNMMKKDKGAEPAKSGGPKCCSK